MPKKLKPKPRPSVKVGGRNILSGSTTRPPRKKK